MKIDNNILNNALKSFEKHFSKLTEVEIQERMSRYDNSKYSGCTVEDFENINKFLFDGIEVHFQKNDYYHFYSSIVIGVINGITVTNTTKTKIDPQNFVGFSLCLYHE